MNLFFRTWFVFFAAVFSLESSAQDVPTDGLMMWHRADSFLVESDLFTLYDLSGNDRNALQNIASSFPDVIEIDLLNDQLALQLDGVNDFLTVPDTFLIGMIFIVSNYLSGETFLGTRGLISALNGGSSNSLIFVGSSGSANFFGGYFSAGNQLHNQSSGLSYAPLTQWKISQGKRPTNVLELGSMIIGRDRTFANRYWNGGIAEIIIYNHVLTSDQTEQVVSYLKNRYTPAIDIPSLVVRDDFCPFTVKEKGFISYEWSDGNISDSLVISGPGTYSLSAISTFNDTIFKEFEVIYPGSFIYNFNLCSGSDSLWTTDLSAFTVEWQDGSSDPDFLISEEGEYYFTVTDSEGCSFESDTVVVTEDSFPVEAALGLPEFFCLGNTLSLATGFAEAETYLWSTGETTPFIVPAEGGTYWVEVTNGNGCVGRDTVEVVIAGVAPDAAFAAGVACAGNEVEFEDVTEGNVVGWNWELRIENGEWAIENGEWLIENGEWIIENGVWVLEIGDGGMEEAVFLGQEGLYGITLTVTLDNGCTGTVRDTVEVYALPEVNFTAPLVCAGTETFFEDLSAVPGGSVDTQAWVFGNGTTDDGVIGSTTFAETGMNTVALTVTSTNGCSASLSRNVEVLGSPVADFAFADVCAGTPVGFFENVDISESGPVFYNWNFGDGFFSNFPNTSHVFSGSGAWEVTLTATGNNGGLPGCVDAVTKIVRVYEAPEVVVELEGGCVGEEVTFGDVTQASVIDGVADNVEMRNWELRIENGEWTPVGSGVEEMVVVGLAGSYEVRLEVVTDAGCVAEGFGEVEVLEVPEAAFGLVLPVEAPPVVGTLVNGSTDAEGYVWLVNGSVVSTEAEPELVFDAVGDFVVELVATNVFGCNDTTSAMYTVLIPEYDIAIGGIEATEVNGRLVLEAILTNFGNVPIETFEMEVQVGQDINVVTQVEHLIQPGTTVAYEVNADFFIIPGRTLPYTCIEVREPNGTNAETNLENNRYCIGLARERAVFVEPFPNPTDDKVELGFIVPNAGDVGLTLVDAVGRVVRDFSVRLEEGYSTYSLDLRDLRSGVYFLRYNFEGEEVVKRVVVY